MSKKYFMLVPLVIASACAYTLEGQFQPLTIRTPGAQDAVCIVMVNKNRYKFYPPETRNVTKSQENLTIDCMAPGNRDRKVIIEPVISKVAPANATNGLVPGTMWDYASGALFTYPDVVEVDFTGLSVKPMPPPAHNNSDIKDPEDYFLEEFRPNSPRMNSDRYEKSIPLKRRVPFGEDAAGYDAGDTEYSGGYIATSEDSADSDKGDLMSVFDNLSSDMDPAVDPNPEFVPIYPGE